MVSRRHSLGFFCVLSLLVACGGTPDVSTPDVGTGGSALGGTGGGGLSGAGGSAGSGGSGPHIDVGEGGEGGSDQPIFGPGCGDGELQDGEECDDGDKD